MKKTVKIILAVLLVMQVLFIAAFAADSGSLTVKLISRTDEKPVAGKALKIYKVGSAEVGTDNAPLFSTDEPYKSAGLTVINPKEDAASKFAQTAKTNSASAQTVTSDSNGRAVINPCELGVYLVCSQDNLFEPFLVSVPVDAQNNGEWDYSVTAEPKFDYEEPTNPEPPTDPESPTTPQPTQPTTEPGGYSGGGIITVNPPSPGGNNDGGSFSTGGSPSGNVYHATSRSGEGDSGKTDSEKLPQTGMLQYPIPILGFGGVILFAAGYLIYGRNKKKETE